MAEWLVEQGIGEERALAYVQDQLVAARIQWSGGLIAGQIEDAPLIARTAGSARGTARFANGEEALVSRLPRDAQEGALLRLEVTRSAFAESSRVKRAHARPTDHAPSPAPDLAEALRAAGDAVQVVRRFPGSDWEDVWGDAWSGMCDFTGGSLHFSPTPAMTLVDIDGAMPPRELALAAAAPLARCIRLFDLAGSIGIDFPTLEAKADRRAVDDALAQALADWLHERTAMNGFGFVQIVARMERPSLVHRIGGARAGAAARLLLRRAEDVADPGALLLTCHPAIKSQLKVEWLEDLARRTGREIRVETNPGLALEGGFAQATPL